VSISMMEEMLEMMKSCNYGSSYVAFGIASSYGKHRNAELAFNLVKELNRLHQVRNRALRDTATWLDFNQRSYL